MYNPRNYAISVEKILGTPQYLTGEIENNPLSFLSSFLDEKYNSDEATTQLIDSFDEKFSKYKGLPLANWEEKDAEQLVKDLRRIF
ncbi:MAG: hypothetical protein J6K64_08575 [Clostridia bacterium]|nr:hypothetical protein [Clostridia bacterium]